MSMSVIFFVDSSSPTSTLQVIFASDEIQARAVGTGAPIFGERFAGDAQGVYDVHEHDVHNFTPAVQPPQLLTTCPLGTAPKAIHP